jgi:protoporphyrinogen oxidase
MTQTNVVVMGAGPAGLTAAYELSKRNIRSTVVEADPRYVGGIAKTIEHNGYRFDIGGHRFFSKNQEIEDLWTEVLGDEMLTRGRISRIYYRGKYFDYPLKALNAFLNLGPIETARCLMSYAWARIHPVKEPRNLEDWVRNQFGYRLFRTFFKTYTEKVWGISTKELSADWAAQRIKGLSMSEAIKNAVLPKRKPKERGAVIKTLIDEFRYPRFGPGQMWERTVEILRERGNTIVMGERVERICHQNGRVTSVLVRGVDGSQREITGDQFVSTLPIRELVNAMEPALPDRIREAANALNYRDFLTVALMIRQKELFPDNWIYIHDPSVKVGRIQNFKNWSPWMVPDQETTCLGLEYFCFEGDGLWTSSDEDLVELGKREVAELGLVSPGDVFDGAVVRQKKAYPVYDDEYLNNVAIVREHIQRHFLNLHMAGRNGMHKYNNQDHSMMTALLVARNIAGVSQLDPWKVNTDAEYHEELREQEPDTAGRAVPRRVLE